MTFHKRAMNLINNLFFSCEVKKDRRSTIGSSVAME